MALVIDVAAANRTVTDEEFRIWAADHSVFLSSVMGELADERRALAEALEAAGFTVRWFEDFGGRDDSAEDAYLSEVAGADIYVGLLGDEYGTMLPTGYSSTHAEYLEARQRGRRISFWARREDDARAGHARNFLSEVQVFQVTGGFDGPGDLAEKVLRRLREMAAQDLAPWVKLGNVVLRANRITDTGTELRIHARVRDTAVLRALEELAPRSGGWGQPDQVQVTYDHRSGTGRVAQMQTETTTQAFRDIELVLNVDWSTTGRDSLTATSGYSGEDLIEVGVRAGLLGEELPEQLRGTYSFMVDGSDPLSELQGVHVPEGSLQSIARLFVVEALVGQQRASSIESFTLGPLVNGARRIEVRWREPQRYSNETPGSRSLEGQRPWG
jgi:hypothetical protein